MNFPNITVGFNRYDNKNNLTKADSNLVDDITDRVLIQLSYDFDYLVKHSSSFSFTTSTRTDNSISNFDAKFNSGSFTLNSYWNQQLSSIFGLVFSSSSISGVPFNYTTVTLGGRYRMLENKLLLSATLSPSFGNFKRQALELTADYNVLKNLNLMFQSRIYRIPGKSTNSIIGLATRLAI
jgi:hypothetical protein